MLCQAATVLITLPTSLTSQFPHRTPLTITSEYRAITCPSVAVLSGACGLEGIVASETLINGRAIMHGRVIHSLGTR